VTGKLPVIVFIPWLSCGPIENPFGPRDGWGKMLDTVMRESKMQVVRSREAGSGDSIGPDCSSSDLDEDMAALPGGHSRRAGDPGVDPADSIFSGQHRRAHWCRSSRRNSSRAASSPSGLLAHVVRAHARHRAAATHTFGREAERSQLGDEGVRRL
jgi:hypothetical protein